MPKVREWVRFQRRPGFFHFNTWLWFVPAFSVPLSKHKLDAIHSSCVRVCVDKSMVGWGVRNGCLHFLSSFNFFLFLLKREDDISLSSASSNL